MRTTILIVAALAAVGCARNENASVAGSYATAQPEAVLPPPAEAPNAAARRATLSPTNGNEAAGVLDLVADNGAVSITGRITGLQPNTEHGFHVHEIGDCSAPDASTAGGHFNPTSQPHGNPATPPHHTGDIPNVTSDAQGAATVNARLEGVTLGDAGMSDIVGKAIVVHAKPDDYKTQPAGGSGDRIACGVIE
jgi:Cu-Zn family superoxide dismutase